MHWMQPFKIKPANAAPFEVGIALAPGMRSLRPAAGVAGLMERISGRAGAGAGAQRALSTNAYKNAYSTFHIVQPGHKRQATASNGRFLLMQATGDSQPRQRLDPAGPSLQSWGFDTAPCLLDSTTNGTIFQTRTSFRKWECHERVLSLKVVSTAPGWRP